MQSDNSKKPVLTRTQQARRKDIILAAIAVINRDGYAAASIDKIAKQANTNKSTVLYHFKSKEAINEALVGTIYEDGAAYMRPYILATHTYREKLEAYLISNLKYIAEHAERIAALHQIAKDITFENYDKTPILWLQKMFEEGQQQREFGTFDPYIMAITIRLTIDSASFLIVTHPSLDIDKYIQEIVQLFDKAVRPN